MGTSLMFRRNASFQLAVAMLILFTSFTAQVLNKPFMAFPERYAVVKFAARRNREKGEKMIAFGDTVEIERMRKRIVMEEQAELSMAKQILAAAKFNLDYNFLESFYLGCAIYVCMAGLMFSSGSFDNPYFKAQRDGLGYLTLTVILFSTLMLFYSVGKDLRAISKWRKMKNKAKWTAFKKKANFHKDALTNLDNESASEEQKQAASKIEAAFKGK